MVSAIVGAAGSLLGGIGSAIASDRASKRQLQAQREENQKNRDFNAEQAALQRQYNSDMVAQQNVYNSPGAMMARLKAAGLNPNLVYGDLGSSPSVGVGNTGAAASHSGGVGGVLPDYSGIQAAGHSAIEAAQIKLLEAQARKTDSERELNDIEVSYRDQVLQGQLDLNGINIDLGEASKHMTEEQANLFAKECLQIDESMNYLRQKIKTEEQLTRLTQEQAIEKILDNNFTSETYELMVRRLQAQTQVDEESAKNIAKALYLQNYVMATQGGLNESNRSLNAHYASESDSRRGLNYRLTEQSRAQINRWNAQNKLDAKYGLKVDEETGKLRISNTYGHAREIVGLFGTAVGAVSSSYSDFATGGLSRARTSFIRY